MLPVKNREEAVKGRTDPLFGPPPLIAGEDEERYWRMHATIENGVNPKNIVERLYVRELTDKAWLQQRNRTFQALVVESAFVEALASLLRPFYHSRFMSLSMDEDTDAAAKMAREYYDPDTKKQRRDELEKCLTIHGITQEHVRIKAMELRVGVVSMFTRMEASGDSSLRMLRKEHMLRLAMQEEQSQAEVAGHSQPKQIEASQNGDRTADSR
jgi:hypothetical protein